MTGPHALAIVSGKQSIRLCKVASYQTVALREPLL